MTTPLTPMAEWIDRQSNTPWSPGFSDDFRRGYDTAVEEASAAYDAEMIDRQRERRERVDPDLRADLIRYFDNAFPKVQQDRWPFTIADLADGIMATIGDYFAATEAATRDASPGLGGVCPYCGDRVTPDEAAEHKARVAAARIPTTPRPR